MTTEADLAVADDTIGIVLAWYSQQIMRERRAYPGGSPRLKVLLRQRHEHAIEKKRIFFASDEEIAGATRRYADLYRQLTAIEFLSPEQVDPYILTWMHRVDPVPIVVARSIAHWYRDFHPAFATLAATGTIPTPPDLLDAIEVVFQRGTMDRQARDALAALASYTLRITGLREDEPTSPAG